MVRAHAFQLALLGATAAGGVFASQAFLRQRREVPGDESPAEVVVEAVPDRSYDSPPPPPEMDEAPVGSLIAAQFSVDPHAGKDRMEMILTGQLALASVRLSPYSLISSTGSYSDDVYVEFCDYDPRVDREDPASYPTAFASSARSDHCGEHRYSLSLAEVMKAADARDSLPEGGMKRLPVSGLLFHAGHSGAGLISNSLATFASARVISEHDALNEALSWCDVTKNRYELDGCSHEARFNLVRDLIALLSRVPSPSAERGLYLKLPSQSAAYLRDLRSMYPSAAWTFFYREPAAVLAKSMERKRNGVCIRARRNPSAALAAKRDGLGVDLEEMSHHEICALHLSTLLDAAVKERGESGTGMLVSYDDVLLGDPNAIMDRILPYLGMKEDIDADPEGVKARVAKVLSVRSNTYSSRKGPVWEVEKVEVSPEADDAMRKFMKESHDSINSLTSAM